jgi:ketosteroid isomerase-like protein
MRTTVTFATVLFATAIVAAPAVAATRDCSRARMGEQKKDVETIKRLELGWLTAEYRGDTAFLDCLLDDGYAAIASKDDTVRSKADLLEHVAKNQSKETPIPPLQSTVVINGDHATAYSTMKGTRKTGEPYEAHFVDAYYFRDGAWHAFGGVDL